MGTPRFHEAVDLYLQGLQAAGRSPYTVKGRRCALSTLRDFAKSDDLRQVSRTIPSFLSGQFAILDHNSATLKWQQLRQFCVFCVKKGWLKDNPFDDLPAPAMRAKIVRPLTDAQLHRLFEVGDVWDGAILAILLGTGMRVGELTALRWQDVDGDTLRLYGKGGKERLVALGVAGSRVLSELPRNGHHVFPFQTSSIQDRFHRLSERSGVHVHAHLLRHSCADRLRQAGVGIEDIGMILGHSDLSTTMRFLGRESERALEAQRRLNPADALLGRGGDGQVLPFRKPTLYP